jgi:hypothetical protein
MYALLENGPLANQQIDTADTPPQVLLRETRFVTHRYELVGIEHIQAQWAPGSFQKVAVYTYAGELAQAA